MNTAVIYARYSSERQTEQSIEGQLRVCNDYAQRHNIKIVDTYIDRAMTGTNDNRAAFQKLLKDSNKKAWNYVLVYKIDRFSRNKYEMAIHKKTLRDNGIKLLSAMENIPDTPEGIILESLLEGMAEYYSAELSQKVKRGMYESRQKGNFTGGIVSYGYRKVGKKIFINDDEAEIVRRIFSEFAAGKLVSEILQELKDQGILLRGKHFGKNTLYHFLKSEKYIGRYTYDNEVYTNIYPAIIDKELYDFVQKKMAENKYGKHNAPVEYLLKNKVICGHCGHIVNSDAGTSKSGKIVRYYKCTEKKKTKQCASRPIRKELLENIVIQAVLSSLSTNDMIDNIADLILKKHKKQIHDHSVINILTNEKTNIETKIKNILKAIECGIITSSTKQHLEQLECQKENIDTKIAIELSKEKFEIKKSDIIKHIKTALEKKPRQMINLLINQVKLYNNQIEIFFKYNKNDKENNQNQIEVYHSNKNISVNNNSENINKITKCFILKANCYILIYINIY